MLKKRAIALTLFAAFLAVTIPANGQEKEAPQKPEKDNAVRKVIQLKYADPNELNSLLSYWGANIRADRGLKALTVVGSKDAVEAIEEAVKKLDVPPPTPKDVELTAYFLLATREPSQAAALPSALNEVVAELKKVVNYQNFTLLNTALIRTQDGRGADVNGAAGGPPSPANFALHLQDLDVVGGQESPAIHLHNMTFEIWNEVEKKASGEEKGSPERINQARIQSDIDIPAGQKVVVGKTSFQIPENALVLVLTAKVL